MDEKLLNDYINRLTVLMTDSKKTTFNEKVSEFSKGQMYMLLYLQKNGVLFPNELKEEMCVGSGRIGNLLKGLENKGVIYRLKNKDDGRKVEVRLTKKGQDLVNKKREEGKRRLVYIIENLGEEKADTFLDILEEIISIISKYKEDKND